MRKFRVIIIIVSIILIIGSLLIINYQDLISRPNLASLLVIIVSLLNIISMTLSIKNEAKNNLNIPNTDLNIKS
jgi:hypothetical protein